MSNYLFNFQGRGVFSPDAKVELSPEQIESHNAAVAAHELEQIHATGMAVLYLFNNGTVGQWASKPFQRSKIMRQSQSRNNWGVRRIDVWFRMDGSNWHGENLGDNDIVRCKRIKST